MEKKIGTIKIEYEQMPFSIIGINTPLSDFQLAYRLQEIIGCEFEKTDSFAVYKEKQKKGNDKMKKMLSLLLAAACAYFGQIGLADGALAAAAVITLRFLVDDYVRTADDVEKYLHLPTLGTIMLQKQSDDEAEMQQSHRKKGKGKHGDDDE